MRLHVHCSQIHAFVVSIITLDQIDEEKQPIYIVELFILVPLHHQITPIYAPISPYKNMLYYHSQ